MALRAAGAAARTAQRGLRRGARYCSEKPSGGEKDGGSVWQSVEKDMKDFKNSPFTFDSGRLTLPRKGGMSETDLYSKQFEKLMSSHAGLDSFNDDKAMQRKVEEMKKLTKIPEHTEEREYMKQTKEDKFRVEPSKVDLSGQIGGKRQQKARDIALNMNPFQGNQGVGTFMDYVEQEQDYYQRGATTPAAYATAKTKARELAVKTAAEIRTTEVLGGTSSDTVFATGPRGRVHTPLTVDRWDMNSFTFSTGQRVVGSCIIFQDNVFLWDVANVDDITMEKMMPIAHMFPVPRFLTLGMGSGSEPLHPDIMMYLRSRGTRVDVMPTTQAISTLIQTRVDHYQCATALLCIEPTNGFDFYSYNKFWKHQRDVAHGKKPGVRHERPDPGTVVKH